ASGLQATPATDVWSWGATLFHALEGRPPYQVGDNLLGALYRIVHEEPPSCEAAGWLAPALAATMTRDPAQRWPMVTAQLFLEAGPQTQPSATPIGGLADLGLADVETVESRRTRSYDDDAGTQVLPLATMTTAPPPTAPASEGDSDQDGPHRPWLLILGATVAVVIAMVVAFAIGLHGRGADNGTTPPSSPGTGTTGPSSSASSTDGPTEAAMVDFVENYIATASSDPAAAFDMLTPAFQQQSGGMSGYVQFWGDVRTAKILDISADPEALEVSYTYRYEKPPGKPTEDDVVLKLTFEKGAYLIDREL
ncbi:MAG: eukaryotic-like serine/threonine-protein kinase, partial [Nocardioidaceae bacterium]|nr:eukaryotic-like serine/threonine-protein kinase [Nocardioidaceae bacterium]